MRNFFLKIALGIIWSVAGKLGKDLVAWISDADKHGLEGQAAFQFVWRKAKTQYNDIGDWLLNLLIESLVGKQSLLEGKLAKKLKWPKKLKFNF